MYPTNINDKILKNLNKNMPEIKNGKIHMTKSSILIILSCIALLLTVFTSPAFSGSQPNLEANAGEVNPEAQLEAKQEELQEKKETLETETKKVELEELKLEIEKKLIELEEPESPKVQRVEQLSQSQHMTSPSDKAKVQAYINKYFPNTPIKAEQIVSLSKEYKIPVGFILAVGHNESHMGTKGRAVPTKNPFNVGNVTAGDNKPTNCSLYSNCLNDWSKGLHAFASLITRCYFYENEAISLQKWIDRDFRAVRCNIKGKRYMTDSRASIKYRERISNLKQLNITY